MDGRAAFTMREAQRVEALSQQTPSSMHYLRLKLKIYSSTHRVVLELCHPRPGVGIVNVDDRVVLLLAYFSSNEMIKETAGWVNTPLFDHTIDHI